MDTKQLEADKGSIYFEDPNSVGYLSQQVIDDIEHIAMTFDGQMILTEGLIRIYNINGVLVAEGDNAISTAELNTGIYVVTVSNNSDFYSTKILVR